MHKKLERIFGDQAPFNCTLKISHIEFHQGHVSLGDKFCQGGRATTGTGKNIEAVWRMIENKNRMTCNDIQASLHIDRRKEKKNPA